MAREVYPPTDPRAEPVRRWSVEEQRADCHPTEGDDIEPRPWPLQPLSDADPGLENVDGW